MRLYLVQHGDAVDKQVDPDRPLSEAGVRSVELVGAFISKAGVRVDEVCHSGKTRARQTAERLAKHVAAPGSVEERRGLGPKDPIGSLRKVVSACTEDLMVVGHLPHLSKVASSLLVHDEEAEVIAFEKGCVVCLERVDDEWSVRWMVTPAIVLGR